MPYRVLIIPSPKTVQPVLEHLASELLSIKRAHGTENVQVLDGRISRADIIEALTTLTPDILHWGGHMTPEGFPLSDEVLPFESLTAYTRAVSPKLVILNTCTSELPAEEIAVYGSDVIYTVSEVEDVRAWEFAVLLHTRIAAGLEFSSACRELDPDGKTYRFARGKRRSMESNKSDGNEEFRTLLRTMQESIDQLTEALLGNTRYKREGVIDTLAKAISRLESLADGHAALERRINALENFSTAQAKTTEQLTESVRSLLQLVTRQDARNELDNPPIVISPRDAFYFGVFCLVVILGVALVIWFVTSR